MDYPAERHAFPQYNPWKALTFRAIRGKFPFFHEYHSQIKTKFESISKPS
jgi:hypothetical protein